MTTASGSKVQELLADYLSQNLKDDSDDVIDIAKSEFHNKQEIEKVGSKHHKKHRHKSKKKRKKSHHSSKGDGDDEARSRSHHKKHRHHRKDSKSKSEAEAWNEKKDASFRSTDDKPFVQKERDSEGTKLKLKSFVSKNDLVESSKVADKCKSFVSKNEPTEQPVPKEGVLVNENKIETTITERIEPQANRADQKSNELNTILSSDESSFLEGKIVANTSLKCTERPMVSGVKPSVGSSLNLNEATESTLQNEKPSKLSDIKVATSMRHKKFLPRSVGNVMFAAEKSKSTVLNTENVPVEKDSAEKEGSISDSGTIYPTEGNDGNVLELAPTGADEVKLSKENEVNPGVEEGSQNLKRDRNSSPQRKRQKLSESPSSQSPKKDEAQLPKETSLKMKEKISQNTNDFPLSDRDTNIPDVVNTVDKESPKNQGKTEIIPDADVKQDSGNKLLHKPEEPASVVQPDSQENIPNEHQDSSINNCPETENTHRDSASATLSVLSSESSDAVVPEIPTAAAKPMAKVKGKIMIKDLSSCMALKIAEEEKQANAKVMEEGEVEDSDDQDEKEATISSGGTPPVSENESGAISDDCDDNKSVPKKKKKSSKRKEKHKKKKYRSHSSERTRSQSRRGSGHDRLSSTQERQNKGRKSKTVRSKLSEHRDRSRSPLPKGKGRSRSPPRSLQGSRYRGRWRSRSPRRPPPTPGDLREKIDKKRLLEIARKNVLQMMQDGTLPAGISVETLKQEQVIAIKAGGKGVDELTVSKPKDRVSEMQSVDFEMQQEEFCRGLVETGGNNSDSSDEKPHSDEESDAFIHHPFKLRDPQPIIRMNIRNAIQLPTRTPAEKTVDAARLRLQFPVSSGSHHRTKELEWVPVEKTEETSAQKKGKEVAVLKPIIPVPEAPKTSNPLTKFFAPGPINPMPPPALPSPLPPLPPPPPEPANEVFPLHKDLHMDVASAILMRVKAVQRLQENPHDVEAMNQMYRAQQQMQQWAQSKLLPGQFGAMGDARMLTPEELSGPTPVWVKKELFQRAAPLRGGIGMHLLKKMGWNPGEGLGKNKEGSLEPLMLDIKTDKKGLVSTGELPQKSTLPTIKMPRDLSAKHPVSALMELCSKRKWGSPDYTLLDETGPAHRKTFLFKVRVMGTDYQPSVSSYNKKQAKALAASVCLQSMGLLPRNLDKPL